MLGKLHLWGDAKLIQSFASQAVHSGVTFSANLWFLHKLEVGDFAEATSIFLIAMAFSPTVTQWVTQLTFSGKAQPAKLGLIAAMAAVVVWVLLLYYQKLFVATADPASISLLWALAMMYLFICVRRTLMLLGRHGQALALDSARLVASVVWIYVVSGAPSAGDYVLWILAAHLPVLVFMAVLPLPKAPPVAITNTLSQRLAAAFPTLSRRGVAVVAAEQAGTVFAQAALLVAPALVSAEAFAANRAYEIFFVLMVFVAQAIEPHYVRIARDWGKNNSWIDLVAKWLTPASVLLIPVLVLTLAQALLPLPLQPVSLLIPSEYLYAKDIFWPVCAAAAAVSLGAPARWQLSANAQGRVLFAGTVLVGAGSIALMFLCANNISALWLPALVRAGYEVAMLLVYLAGVAFVRWAD